MLLNWIFRWNGCLCRIYWDGWRKHPLIQPGASFNVTFHLLLILWLRGILIGVTAKSSVNENVQFTGNAKFIVGNLGWINYYYLLMI